MLQLDGLLLQPPLSAPEQHLCLSADLQTWHAGSAARDADVQHADDRMQHERAVAAGPGGAPGDARSRTPAQHHLLQRPHIRALQIWPPGPGSVNLPQHG